MADLTSGHTYANSAIPAWNSAMRLGFFLIITFLIIKIRKLLEYEQATSRTDFLTGASNSRSFYESLKVEAGRSARSGRPYSVAYIDVDNFKTVNDTRGHSIGDELLLAVSSTVRQTTRSQDIVARLGGDEFAVLLPETSGAQVRPAADKIREQLLGLARQHQWPVTFSIGVVTCNGLCDPDEIVRQADYLMCEVKRTGKNSIAYGTYTKEISGP
ncbi:MAG: GGDEF domain-containing protein [Nitrospirae bacterium]|nr:GGDEF domain-containing protein [Nitrospirota bacterium]